MKSLLSKKTNGRIILSMLTAALFIFLALASDFGSWGPEETRLEDGRVQSVETYNDDCTSTTVGMRDNKERWHGEVEIKHDNSFLSNTKEVAYFDHGVRNGLSTTTYYAWDGKVDFKVEKVYILGVVVSEKDILAKSTSATSPQDILYSRYFWFQTTLQNMGFDSLYVRNFMDTVMIVLDSYEFSAEDFDEYYFDVMDELEDTPWDSIITHNYRHAIFKGLERIKNNEYRMAAIDRYLLGASTTYEVIQDIYPGYLTRMEELEVSSGDFEGFSHVVDSILATYSPLDIEDPDLVDSVDSRLFRAIEIVSESDETKKAARAAIRDLAWDRDIFSMARDYYTQRTLRSNNTGEMHPADVANEVMNDILASFNKADMIGLLVKEAWMKNKGVVYLPVLTTQYLGSTTGADAEIRGLILEDGGDAVHTRGIVWADHYNPGMTDIVENSGSGTGYFTVSLSGLTLGKTYYARSFATNSAGTVFGPGVEFKAQSTLGNAPEASVEPSLRIYPNPASSTVQIDISLVDPCEISLLIHDLKGSLQVSSFQGNLPAGMQTLKLDVSALQEGFYQVEVRSGQERLATGKLLIH